MTKENVLRIARIFGVVLAVGLFLFVVVAFCPDRTLASCFIDVIVLSMFLVAYYDDKPVVESQFSETMLALSLIGLVMFWVVIQQTGLFLQDIINDPLTDAYVGSGEPDSVLYLMLVLVFAPFMEELVFRDRLYRSFCHIMPNGWACIFGSILFGLVHGTIIHIYLGTMMGLFFSCVYRVSGQLWLCVVMHSLFNLMSLWLSPGNPSGDFLWVLVLAFLNILVIGTMCASWSISRKDVYVLRKKIDIL